MDWTIPHTSGAQISVPLEAGARLFLMGRTGSGKSALILELLGQAKDRSVSKTVCWKADVLCIGGRRLNRH